MSTVKFFTKVKDVEDTNVVAVDANTTVSEVVKKMLQESVWSVVVTEEGLPIGVVTDHDVLRRCDGKGLDASRVKVKEIMSSPLLLIDADAPIGEAMTKMIEMGVRRLYIVENGKVVGRITDRSVLENNLDVMSTLSSMTV